MRIHKDFFGEHDLDDTNTYSYLPTDKKELDDLMFTEIGKALVYMDYFHPDCYGKKSSKEGGLKNSGYKQRKKVNELIAYFAKNRKYNYDNILWRQEQIFLFQSCTENMC